MCQNITNQYYVVIKGVVGLYEHYRQSLLNAENQDPRNIISVPRATWKKYLTEKLFELVTYRNDLDYRMFDFLSNKTIRTLEYLQDNDLDYTSVYINRSKSPTGQQYALVAVLPNNNIRYYKSRESNVPYYEKSDIVPLMIIRDIEERYGVSGRIISSIPLEKEMHRVPNWTYVKHYPFHYNIMMSHVNDLLLSDEFNPTVHMKPLYE